jgi:hypothetical protein
MRKFQDKPQSPSRSMYNRVFYRDMQFGMELVHWEAQIIFLRFAIVERNIWNMDLQSAEKTL